MSCPSCSAENPAGARFCNGCGALQAVVCPRCSQGNPPTSRFCNACGGPLAESGPPRPAATEPASTVPSSYTPRHLAAKILADRDALEGERKLISVLFADITGSTELIQDLDPEEARALLEPAVSAMIDAVHRFEGTVCRVMGDGIMALFGAPLAHEDHAARACYAALTMQDAIRRYGDSARQQHGVEILARVGLNSGEVVVGSISNDLYVEYSAIGPTTHLAARMEQLALPGTIRLTAETLQLVEGLIDVRALGRIPVRGLAAPVEAFELLAAAAGRRRFQAAASRGLTPFVGRQAEIAALQQALDLARSGHGQVVAPVGEPGVGKSRLFYEFVRSHRTAGCLVLESGSVSYGKATLWLPVVDLLRSYCRIEPSDDARAAREKLVGKLLTLDRVLETILSPLLALLDLPVDDPSWAALDPSQRRRVTLEALQRLLLRESQEQPLVLVFEDLHWIDSETQALLDSMVTSLPTARILLLVNYRPEYSHSWGNRSYYTQLRIDPLAEAGADALLAGLLGSDASVEPLKPLLIRRTEGTPLYLEECVRSLVETGALDGQRGAYRLARPVDEIRVPATVQTVLAARIDRLPADEKRLLQTAAVIGKDVPFRLLQAITQTPETELHASLSHLQEAELVYAMNLFPELELTFKHALTHEVAYGTLLQERRRALHARIVTAIERLFPDRLDEHVEQIAHHAVRGDVWDRAVGYCRRAGLEAAARSANRAAAAWFEQALAAQQRLPESRETLELAVDLGVDLHRAHMPLGELGQAFDRLRQVEVLAERLGDQRRLGSILIGVTSYLILTGDPDRALATGRRVLEIGDALGDEVLQARAYHLLGWAFARQGAHVQARAELTQALLVLDSLRARGDAGLELAQTENGVLGWVAWCLTECGDFIAAIETAEKGLRIAEASGRVSMLTNPTYNLGLALLRQGHVRRTIEILERGLEVARAAELQSIGYYGIACFLAEAYIEDGRIDEALPLLQHAAAQSIAERVVVDYPLAAVPLGQAYLELGQYDAALREARRSLEISQAHRVRASEAWTRRLLGEIAARGEPTDADEAERQYQLALTLAEELGMRPLQARCHLGLGRLYHRTDRPEGALAELTTAVSMLREMGMDFWLSDAEAELAWTTASASSEPVD